MAPKITTAEAMSRREYDPIPLGARVTCGSLMHHARWQRLSVAVCQAQNKRTPPLQQERPPADGGLSVATVTTNSDQANDTFRRRWRKATARPTKPRIIIAHVPGSGTALAVDETRKNDSPPSLALFHTAWNKMFSVEGKPARLMVPKVQTANPLPLLLTLPIWVGPT